MNNLDQNHNRNPQPMTLVVAAAGRGSRMGRICPKALVNSPGGRLIEVATSAFLDFVTQVVIVISPQFRQQFETELPVLGRHTPEYVIQEHPSGTADAIHLGLRTARFEVVVGLWADHIGAQFMKIDALFENLARLDWDIAIPTVFKADPYAYLKIDSNWRITEACEVRNGAPKVANGWSDCGTFVMRRTRVLDHLSLIDRDTNNETSFLAGLEQLSLRGVQVRPIVCEDQLLTLGANSPSDIDLFPWKMYRKSWT